MKHPTNHRSVLFAFVLSAAFLTACSEGREPSAPEVEALVTPLCQEGCQEVDPFPNSPGIFLTSSTTPTKCEEGQLNDSDVDGLSDDCETRLAAAFAPELYTAGALDNTGREPRWVANLQPSGAIRIMYLISYYNDAGSTTFGCFLKPDDCAPHVGDSEWIILDVKYVPSTTHWLLSAAYYSQHESWQTFLGSGANPPALYYPNKSGGYPRSYVAQGKHANYGSLADCNAGGTAGSDDCSNVNTPSRLTGGVTLNMGSSGHHAGIGQNCVVSANPLYYYYGSGKTECYWSGGRFRGWVPDSVGGGDADPYGPKLIYWGF